MEHIPFENSAANSGQSTEVCDVIATPPPGVAVSFRHDRDVKLSRNALQSVVECVYGRDQIFASSTTGTNPVSDIELVENRSPYELVHEFKRISGLTWEQIARIFKVSKRTIFAWAAGNPVNANNHEKLGRAVAAIRFIDRGFSEENRNLLLTEAVLGRSYIDLFRAGEFGHAQELAGEGEGRPDFGQELTAEAERYNAPPHFGKSVAAGGDSDWIEILPVSKPKGRRVRVHRDRV